MSEQEPRTELPPEVATQERPAKSPSGKLVLEVLPAKQDSFPAQRFQIRDREGEVVYECPDSYLERALTFFLWDPQDRVWVYSGDRGTFFWEQGDEPGAWEKSVYAQSDVAAPQFLKDVRPRWHQR
jgi:hypothetical protein